MARSHQLFLGCLFLACGARSEPDNERGPSPGGGACPAGLPGPELVPRFDAAGDPACIDATEVTNADYAGFLAAAPSLDTQPPGCGTNITFVPPFLWPPTGRESFPVVNVDWCDARAFCEWSGKHLCGLPGGGTASYETVHEPSQSAWFDACSEHGSRRYAYADTYDGSACNGIDLGLGTSFEVMSSATCSGPRPGLFDLSGNVWEWEDACEGDHEEDNCRVRGGSFRSDGFNLTCDTAAGAPRYHLYDDFGFRCCLD